MLLPCYNGVKAFPPSFTTPPYDIDGDPSSFGAEERRRVIAIWRAITEVYSLFDVDITTGGLSTQEGMGLAAG
jgi:hypothetical protein